MAEIGRTADEAGFASLWVMDHFFQIGTVGEVEEPMLEGYSALNFLAGITDRVKLGTLVTGVHYRYPGILLKTVTTLDVLSGGRAYLGIGAGMERARVQGLGRAVPAHRGALRGAWRKPCRSPTRCGQRRSSLMAASITTSRKP